MIVDYLEFEFNKVIEVVGKDGDFIFLGFFWVILKDVKDVVMVVGNINYEVICKMVECFVWVM